MPHKLRLHSGQHVQNDENGDPRVYRPGDILLNEHDLAARWPEKFERVYENLPTTPSPGQPAARTIVPTEEGPERDDLRNENRGEGLGPMTGRTPQSDPDHPRAGPPAVASPPGNPPPQPTRTPAPANEPPKLPTPPASSGPPPHPPVAKGDDTDATLNSMTVAELKAHAEEEEIDLKGAKSKEEIIKAIKAADAAHR